jgi:transposase-like protein
MPKAFPKEFREDVIRVARASESSVAQVAKDFGSPSRACIGGWLRMTSNVASGPASRRVSRPNCVSCAAVTACFSRRMRCCGRRRRICRTCR